MLTGQIRYRHGRDYHGRELLVLQVEFKAARGYLDWRDAKIEDLTVGIFVVGATVV